MPLCRIYRRLVLHSARDRVRGGSLNALVDFIETISTPGLYPPTSHNSSICPVCGCVSQFDCESFSFFYILSPSRLYSIIFEFFDGFLLERIWCELTRRSLLTRFFPPIVTFGWIWNNLWAIFLPPRLFLFSFVNEICWPDCLAFCKFSFHSPCYLFAYRICARNVGKRNV